MVVQGKHGDRPVADAAEGLRELRDGELPQAANALLDVLRGDLGNLERLLATRGVDPQLRDAVAAQRHGMQTDLAKIGEDIAAAITAEIDQLESVRRPVVHISSTDPAHRAIRRHKLPDTDIVVDNTFIYTTDSHRRVVQATATLTLRKPGGRNKRAQRTLPGKRPGDDAGHLVADMFGGIGDHLNLVPMLREVNRRQMARLEQRWKKAIDAGKTVDLTIEPDYGDGESPRPTALGVTYKIEGEKSRTVILENPLPEESEP